MKNINANNCNTKKEIMNNKVMNEKKQIIEDENKNINNNAGKSMQDAKIEKAHFVEMPHTKKQLIIDKDYKFGPKNKFVAVIYYLIWLFVLFFVKIYNKVLLGFKVENKKSLHKLKRSSKKGIITVSNHMHIMDSIMIADIVSPYKTEFTSIQSNFTIPFVGKLIEILGCVPIPDEISKMRYFFEHISKRLKQNKVIHYFPEGVLRPYCNELYDFSKGAFVQAYRNNSPIVPIVFAQKKAKGIFKFTKQKKCCFTAYILEPQYADTTLPKREAVQKLQDNVRKVMKEKLESCSEKVVDIDYTDLKA